MVDKKDTTKKEEKKETKAPAKTTKSDELPKLKGRYLNAIGRRKRSVARAIARKGKGKILVNSKPLSAYTEIPRMFMSEPLLIGKEIASGLDISVYVFGGGVMGQAGAVRQALAKSLTGFSKALKTKFLQYDRTLLVADSRRTEPHKPSRSKKGPRRHLFITHKKSPAIGLFCSY